MTRTLKAFIAVMNLTTQPKTSKMNYLKKLKAALFYISASALTLMSTLVDAGVGGLSV